MLSDLDVENVYIYIADALREDFLPTSVGNRGLRFKTVAAGIQSPTSISSIVSGTYLPQHNVGRFQDTLPGDVPNIVNRTDVETAFANTAHTAAGRSADSPDLISDTINVNRDPVDRIESIESPFAFVERALGAHAPYTDRESFKIARNYYAERSEAPRHQFSREYQQGIDSDTEQFRARLETLDERGLLDDTLVIYTSDHGEFLGEHGSLAHVPPIHPNLAYVPTVFIHPDLPSGEAAPGVLRHVDLLSTVSGLLDWEWETPVEPVGRDLTRRDPAEHGCTFYESLHDTPIGERSFRFEAAWDRHGGYVFPPGLVDRAVLAGYHAAESSWRGYAHRHPVEYAIFKLRGTRCHRAPGFSEAEARRHITEARKLDRSAEPAREHEISTEQLRDLGYIE